MTLFFMGMAVGAVGILTFSTLLMLFLMANAQEITESEVTDLEVLPIKPRTEAFWLN